jgi:hypothetical protein
MIDSSTAGVLRVVGLLGLAISLLAWALAERSTSRKALVPLSAGTALLFVLIYLLGVMAVADAGASRFLPRFP